MRQLAELNALLGMKLRVEERAYNKLVAREAAIRADLEKLSERARDSRQSTSVEMKAIGADISWQAWLGRSTAALNLQLAQILAQKDSHVDQVRKAHGKVSVSEELIAKEKESIRRAREKKKLGDLNWQYFGSPARTAGQITTPVPIAPREAAVAPLARVAQTETSADLQSRGAGPFGIQESLKRRRARVVR